VPGLNQKILPERSSQEKKKKEKKEKEKREKENGFMSAIRNEIPDNKIIKVRRVPLASYFSFHQ
jgi:hypothetical protein